MKKENKKTTEDKVLKLVMITLGVLCLEFVLILAIGIYSMI